MDKMIVVQGKIRCGFPSFPMKIYAQNNIRILLTLIIPHGDKDSVFLKYFYICLFEKNLLSFQQHMTVPTARIIEPLL